MIQTLVSARELRAHVSEPDWAIVDCRFSLLDTERGREKYRAGHIPGAVYAHLDDDLSGPVVAGVTGRHPLPSIETTTATFESWGIDKRVQVIAYDDAGGAIAARLWWMLRHLGHTAAAVLDGGWSAWTAENGPTRAGTETRAPRTFRPAPREDDAVDAGAVDYLRNEADWKLLDARDAERYRGEVEPIDPVAGHIPGAVSVPFRGNLDEEGRFLSREALRVRFAAVAGAMRPDHLVSYCGSGVTACHLVLAMEHAGLTGSRLYPGSWSDWITDPRRPVD